MPRAQTTPDPVATAIDALLTEAARMVPLERGKATMTKWMLFPEVQSLPPHEYQDAADFAAGLMADLLLSQPSPSGATAFDRLAKSRSTAGTVEAEALAALRLARYRMLRIESASPHAATVSDIANGQTLRLVAPDFPQLAPGTQIFTRLAVLKDGTAYIAGEVTPLDEAAARVAINHPARGNMAVAGNARWGEAVFAHVVRHGTLEVPGLNAPEAAAAPQSNDPFSAMCKEWTALGSGNPSPDLLQRTRQYAVLDLIILGMLAVLGARELGQTAGAASLQRMVLVMLETVARRERVGCGGLSMDAIAQAIAQRERTHPNKPGLRELFKNLRQRAGAVAPPPGIDSADMASLMQRIQGLRAKTVERGCTEAEALAAAEKVAELLDRYGLSLGEIEFGAQSCDGVAVQTSRRRAGPIDSCVPTIAQFFDCRVWLESARGQPLRYMFFGLRTDVAAAEYLYELVERAFVTETDAFRAGEIYAAMAGERRTATTSFQTGLATGICDKLLAIQAARNNQRRSASGRDLVLVKGAMVDEELEKLGLALEKRNLTRSRSVITTAYEAGEEAATRFEYTPALHRAA